MNKIDTILNELQIEDIKIGDIVEISSQKDNKNYIGLVVKKYPNGKRNPNKTKVKIANKNEYVIGFVINKLGRKFKLKGDYIRMKRGVEYLRKLDINIIIDNMNKKIEWKHIDNEQKDNTLIQILLNNAKENMFSTNILKNEKVPYGVFYIINSEIVGIQYYNEKNELIIEFLNEQKINFL